MKNVDLQPTELWILASFCNGSVCVWIHETQTLVKTFDVCDLPSTYCMFEAHSDYIQCTAVHPIQPYILTSSDDMLIKLWDWEKKWCCSQVLKSTLIMLCKFASLDRTIKGGRRILGSASPNFTLECHEKGVNCINYYSGGDKPYIISGADDHLVKIWDYQVFIFYILC
uniref:Uncharacterized protein n=1 Tax=Erpetoichthys calabaricus TaxID=27687 RepID=A0A8C4RVI9_ERPCA